MMFYESFKFKADYVSSAAYLRQFEVSSVTISTVTMVTNATGWTEGRRIYRSNR